MPRRGQLNFHHIPDHVSDGEDENEASNIGPAPVPKVRTAKHTLLNGNVSTRSYYHESLPSPSKVPPPVPQVWDDSFGNDTGGPIDDAYQHHRDTVDVDPNPRAYTQAVSSK